MHDAARRTTLIQSIIALGNHERLQHYTSPPQVATMRSRGGGVLRASPERHRRSRGNAAGKLLHHIREDRKHRDPRVPDLALLQREELLAAPLRLTVVAKDPRLRAPLVCRRAEVEVDRCEAERVEADIASHAGVAVHEGFSEYALLGHPRPM